MPSPIVTPRIRFFDADGAPLSLGWLHTYAAGTTTPLGTTQDSAGLVSNTNPIHLDASGECVVWLGDAGAYDFELKNAALVTQPSPGLGVQSVRRIVATADTAIRDDLEDATDSENGAGMVGFNATLNYAVGTLGWHDALQDIDPCDFPWSAPTNGVTDATAALQAAIDTGKNIKVGKNRLTFKTSAALVCATASQVIDFGFATIELNDATALLSHFMIGDNVTQLNGVRLRNAVFTRTQAATGGAAIHCQFVGDTLIENCRVFGNSRIHRGLVIERGIRVRVANNYIQDTVSTGIYLQGTGTGANRCVDIELLTNRIGGCGGAGLSTYDYVEGVYCRGNIFYDCLGCVTVNATTPTEGLFSFKFEGNDFDTATGGGLGIFIDKVSNITINDNWFSNNSGKNIQVGADCDSYVVSGNQVYGTAGVISMELHGDNGVVTNNLLSGGEDGIYVKSTVNTLVIDGNIIRGMAGWGINQFEAPTAVLLGTNVFLSNSTGNVSTGPALPTIASAGTITLTGQTDTFTITGTTTINDIAGGWPGRKVVLVFAGALTVTHATASSTSVRLAGNVNRVTAALQTLEITHNGAQWVQTGGAA